MVTYLNKKVIVNINSISSKYKGKSITIAIDSSKQNTAIVIMNKHYKVLDLIEFDGSKTEILDLIVKQRECLKLILEGAIIEDVGIEDIITSKTDNDGLKHHHSRYVITAVFVSLICFFQDNFQKTPELIPNQTWKSAILPRHLNSHTVYKGSVTYLKDKFPQYITGVKDDDGTDAICIGMYMKLRKGYSKDDTIEEIPSEAEFEINHCKFRLYPASSKVSKDKSVQFEYNKDLALNLNVRAIANRIKKDQLGWAVCSIEDVSISDIYEFCTGNFTEHTTEFKVIVKRTD